MCDGVEGRRGRHNSVRPWSVMLVCCFIIRLSVADCLNLNDFSNSVSANQEDKPRHVVCLSALVRMCGAGPWYPVGTHAATVWSVRQERCEVTSQVTSSRCWATCWLKQTACDAKKKKSCGALCSLLPELSRKTDSTSVVREVSLTETKQRQFLSFFLLSQMSWMSALK